MNVHQNARLTPDSRAALVGRVLDQNQPVGMVAAAFGICSRAVRKWVGRFQAEGQAGVADRSSRPHRLYRSTAAPQRETIIALRRQRLCGNHIAVRAGVSPATVSRILRQAGLLRLRALEPAAPIRRYQYAEPGGLIHLDIKTLGRFDKAGHRVTGDRQGQSNSRASAGNMAMSVSTMPCASPAPPFMTIRKPPAPWPSSVPQSPTTPASASPLPAS